MFLEGALVELKFSELGKIGKKWKSVIKMLVKVGK